MAIFNDPDGFIYVCRPPANAKNAIKIGRSDNIWSSCTGLMGQSRYSVNTEWFFIWKVKKNKSTETILKQYLKTKFKVLSGTETFNVKNITDFIKKIFIFLKNEDYIIRETSTNFPLEYKIMEDSLIVSLNRCQVKDIFNGMDMGDPEVSILIKRDIYNNIWEDLNKYKNDKYETNVINKIYEYELQNYNYQINPEFIRQVFIYGDKTTPIHDHSMCASTVRAWYEITYNEKLSERAYTNYNWYLHLNQDKLK